MKFGVLLTRDETTGEEWFAVRKSWEGRERRRECRKRGVARTRPTSVVLHGCGWRAAGVTDSSGTTKVNLHKERLRGGQRGERGTQEKGTDGGLPFFSSQLGGDDSANEERKTEKKSDREALTAFQ